MLRNEISNGTKPHASPLLTPERLFGFFLRTQAYRAKTPQAYESSPHRGMP